MKNRYLAVLALVLALALLAGGYYWRSQKSVVATVNGRPITAEDFYKSLESRAGNEVLSHLINRQLLVQAATEQGMRITDEQIDAEIDQLKAQFPSEAMFEAFMQRMGLEDQGLREQVEVNLILQALAQRGVEITDQMISEYFEAHASEFDEPRRVKVSHILVKDKTLADDLLVWLRNGEDFAELARKYSQDHVSKEAGGDLGYISSGQTDEEFERAAFSLEPGGLGGPVKTSYGYHVIKVHDVLPPKKATLENSKDKIRQILLEQKARPFAEVLEELRSNADVEVRWERYKDRV